MIALTKKSGCNIPGLVSVTTSSQSQFYSLLSRITSSPHSCPAPLSCVVSPARTIIVMAILIARTEREGEGETTNPVLTRPAARVATGEVVEVEVEGQR